jgi:hypothetical protein
MSRCRFADRLRICSGVLVLAVSLLLAACGAPSSAQGEKPTPVVPSEPTLEPFQFTTSSGAPFPVPTTDANPILTIGRNEAWGSALDIKSLPARVDDDYYLQPIGVSPDARFVVALVLRGPCTCDWTARVVTVDVATGARTEIGALTTLQGNMVYTVRSAAVSGDWIVWPDADHFSAFNTATNALQTVPIGHGTEPVLDFFMDYWTGKTQVDHNVLVWSEGSPGTPDPGRQPTVVKSRDLNTGEETVLGRGGQNPVISYPYVAWIEADLTTLNEGDVLSRIVVANLETHELRRELPGLRWPYELALKDGWLVTWSHFNTTFLENLEQTRRFVIRPQEGVSTSGLTLNDRIVTWMGQGPTRVWDRRLERLVLLDSGGGGMTFVNGNALVWEASEGGEGKAGANGAPVPPGDFTIYVMDTGQLAR